MAINPTSPSANLILAAIVGAVAGAMSSFLGTAMLSAAPSTVTPVAPITSDNLGAGLSPSFPATSDVDQEGVTLAALQTQLRLLAGRLSGLENSVEARRTTLGSGERSGTVPGTDAATSESSPTMRQHVALALAEIRAEETRAREIEREAKREAAALAAVNKRVQSLTSKLGLEAWQSDELLTLFRAESDKQHELKMRGQELGSTTVRENKRSLKSWVDGELARVLTPDQLKRSKGGGFKARKSNRRATSKGNSRKKRESK